MKRMCRKQTSKVIGWTLVLTLILTFLLPWVTDGRMGSFDHHLAVSFEGIGRGVDPKGNHFDINVIKSDVVLKKAIEIAGAKKSVTVEELRRAITIKPIVGSDALAELMAMPVTQGKTSSVIQKSVHAANFVIMVQVVGAIPNPWQDYQLSEGLMKAYTDYLKESYLSDASLSAIYQKEELYKLDYPEMMMVMEQDGDALVRYIDGFVQSAPKFVSPSTGLSFGDLKAKAVTIRDKDIGSAADIADYYVLSKDDANRIAYERVKLKRANLIYEKTQGEANGIGYILQSYDNTANYMAPSDSPVVMAGKTENEFYGHLMDQLVVGKNKIIDAQYQTKEIQRHIDRLLSQSNDMDKEAMIQNTVSDGKKAYTRMEELRGQVRLLAEENYDVHIGSKIHVSRVSYSFNCVGNIVVNFVAMLLFVLLVQAAIRVVKSKEKGEWKDLLAEAIAPYREKLREKMQMKK